MPASPEPLTERILPRAGLRRWLAIVGWCLIPFVRLVAVALLLAASGVTEDAFTWAAGRTTGALLNVYLIAVTLVGLPPVVAKLIAIGKLGGASTERVARWRGAVVPTTVIALLLTVLTESSIVEFGVATALSSPLPFVVSFAGNFLIRVPQAGAFWLSVVALLTVAALGRQPVPGRFPEDRSLGLKGVGQLVTTILFYYIVLLTPSVLVGTSRFQDFVAVLSLFALGLIALVVAVWTVHSRMAAERTRAVAEARAAYAKAYREAANHTDEDTARQLRVGRMLLDGAESIHEWPFDDRAQRVLGLLLSGVITGVVVRLAVFVLGI